MAQKVSPVVEAGTPFCFTLILLAAGIEVGTA